MAVRIQFRRGTAAEWTSANPTLAPGELGYETDTAKFKLGDGTTTWTSLAYGGVNQADIDAAVANVIDLAPGTLDTLNELAASIGDDSDFANTVQSNIQAAEANAQSYANTAASSAQANAQAYADTAISNLVESAPGTLDTLNELAAALGDDPNFATSIATNLSTKLEFVADTSANFTAANALTVANTLYVELDVPGYIRIGDGVTYYNDLAWAGKGYTDTHNLQTTNVHGIADTSVLVVESQLEDVSNDITTHSESTTDVHGIANTALLVTTSDLEIHTSKTTDVHGISNTAELVTNSDLTAYAPVANATFTGTVSLPSTTSIGDVNADEISYLDGVTSGIQAQLDLLAPISTPTFTGSVTLPGDTSIGNVSAVEIGSLEGVTSAIQTQIDAKEDSVTAAATYAPLSNATLSGTVSLPTTTSIGDVDSTEIGHLNGVTSGIQTQLDGKLGITLASTTYAPIANATLTGTVSLPATTSIGEVSATEIGYLNNVSSAIQTQLDAKAPIASPTFTGTVSGVTAAMVGLGNVDNTSDANKPVSTATQAALDAKLSLAGGTMTGKITLDGDPTQALHATTKQYVDNVTSGILAKPSVKVATTANLTATYDNGTDGAGATLTATSNEAFPTVDGETLSTVNGDRGILVKNQTNPAENGRYNLTTQGDENTPWVLTRCGLCDTADEIPGMYVFVTDGTTNGQTAWVAHVDDVDTFAVGTDDIDLFQFAGSGTVTAGTNISVNGNEVSVVAEPTFANVVTVSGGVKFADNTIQTSAGVPSLTEFVEKTASYTLDTLDHKDNVVEMNSSSALTFTIPTNADLAWPVGASMDIIQTGAGQVTISPDTGVTLNYTPGNKLRTQWSSCTIMKRATDSWIVYGDLTA